MSEPSPGPTSTTTSFGPTPAIRTIFLTVLASTTKFCPHCFVGRRPSRAASSRIWAAPRYPLVFASTMTSTLGENAEGPGPLGSGAFGGLLRARPREGAAQAAQV